MFLSSIGPGALGIILGVIVAIVAAPVAGAAVLVAVAALGSVLVWRGAPASMIRAIAAQTSDATERPRLHNLVNGLCATMGLPAPAILVVESSHPNAMAVGRNPATASLVVTSELDRALSLVELEGVLAHELVHIKRHDTVLSGVAVMLVAPLAVLVGARKGASIVHQAVGHGREYSADQRAVTVVRYPGGLASALHVMSEGANSPSGVSEDRNPSAASRRAALTSWLWIHPLDSSVQGEAVDGELDDTAVRSAALSLL